MLHARRIRDRVASWLRNPSIMRAFFCYAAVWAVAATIVAVLGISALMDLHYKLTEEHRAEHVEVNAGPYIYDAATDELIPATPIYLDNSYDQIVFVAFAAARHNYASGSVMTGGWSHGGQAVDATMGLLREDPVYEVTDWGGNYTEQDYIDSDGSPYDPDGIIPIDKLPTYDARERAGRAQTTDVLSDDELGAGVLTSNVAYYVFLEEGAYLRPIDWALRLAAGIGVPIVAYGGGALVMFRRFYRRYISGPLDELARSAKRIAARDLDFTIEPVRGRELGRLSEVLERMRASLLDAERELWRTAEERRRLNAAFAHDLRTPITVLRGTVEMARMRLLRDGAVAAETGDGPDAGDAKRLAAVRSEYQGRERELLDKLLLQVDRLEAYAVSMSRVSKLEDRAPERHPYRADYVAGLLEEYVRAYVGSCGREVSLGFQMLGATECVVHLDLQLVEEVLGNVLSNACDHARSEADVTFATPPMGDEPTAPQEAPGREDACPDRAASAGAVLLTLTVADDGPGFSPEALARGCDPYFGERRSAEHFGLGLHIARTLARRHGGDVMLANREEGGARIALTFAVGPDPSESPA